MRCDCHIHIVGDVAEYPQTGARSYLALPAPLGRIRAFGAVRAISRFVIVQPSFYGVDNRLLLDSLDELGPLGRGVAVVDPDRVRAHELDEMHHRGVRGLRLNNYGAGQSADPSGLRNLIDLAAARNWHVEVIAPLLQLARIFDLLASSPAPVVIDHYGLPDEMTPDGPVARAFLELLSLPSVWMKLSAPYRSGKNDLRVKPDPQWLAAILEVAPDRCVWGSDWPHTPAHSLQKGRDKPVPYRELDYRTMVDEFVAALPQGDLARKVLEENPARLYDFGDHE